MRIDKLLAHSGFGTRKEVKKILKDKLVVVNGELVTNPKTHVDEKQDTIEVQGAQVDYQEYVYFMMNKPQGVISATEDNFQETVIDILEPSDIFQNPHPVGRLDIDTEGLLILTNDGKLTHLLTSPKRGIEKKYYALIEGIVDESDIEKFSEGLYIDEEFTAKPAKLDILNTHADENQTEIEVIVTEGKFHQVKRMFEAVDKEVVFLKRLTMGQLELDPMLEAGEYRELTDEEVQLLSEA